mmetsp:Transcript_10150/g.31057  ORF Transcript_10150/g.31057 Transcript_10150/m.31057 type:complete len:294 (-) Transcript_10150:167-1048(-)|eukprot:CAMPEP_0198724390 /NCGR_PEP_ID=MMETSP1475-20131203/1876_1 /TAXON_ID= ORGANISM="Unidentified sp., Strain CCMP1999" /NCGR_SAMPLE_ID=MMETSP1475 /ASSEMBLY_ACC=CAM_ASM_001111 /LENGTH=293 /DNA_ID=CAMNT_0044485911 /DNA_START=72 /DNA_END=953 /DNA_ORIENTATION=+
MAPTKMCDSAFKKKRPEKLMIPTGIKDEDISSTSQLADFMANMDCSLDCPPPPMSAPSYMTQPELESTFRDMLAEEKNPNDSNFTIGSRNYASQQFMPPANLASPVTNPFMTPRERIERSDSRTRWQNSLPNSPDSRRLHQGVDFSTSGITTPSESPRPGSESYKEKSAQRRQLRALYRAVKLNRPSANLCGLSLEQLSAMLADRDQTTEPDNPKAIQALKNRENAAKARQTTKDNLQKLKDQNNLLKSEVADLQSENQNLKAQMEQLLQMFKQINPGSVDYPVTEVAAGVDL